MNFLKNPNNNMKIRVQVLQFLSIIAENHVNIILQPCCLTNYIRDLLLFVENDVYLGRFVLTFLSKLAIATKDKENMIEGTVLGTNGEDITNQLLSICFTPQKYNEKQFIRESFATLAAFVQQVISDEACKHFAELFV